MLVFPVFPPVYHKLLLQSTCTLLCIWLKPCLYDRVLRTTDLLFESYYNNPNVSLNARILLQVSALEVLLDLPTERPRMHLKAEIEAMTVLPTDPVVTYPIEIRPGNTQTETKSIKVKWA